MTTARNIPASTLLAVASICAVLLINGATQRTLAQQNQDQAQGKLTLQQRPEVNQRALREFLAHVRAMYQAGEFDVNAPLALNLEADHDASSKLSNAVVTQQEGDPKYWQLATEFVSALSESGVLRFTDDAGHLSFNLKADDADISIHTTLEYPSAERAAQMAKAHETLFKGFARIQRGTDAEVILQNLKVSSSGKQMRFDFRMPRSTFGALLSKYLSSH